MADESASLPSGSQPMRPTGAKVAFSPIVVPVEGEWAGVFFDHAVRPLVHEVSGVKWPDIDKKICGEREVKPLHGRTERKKVADADYVRRKLVGEIGAPNRWRKVADEIDGILKLAGMRGTLILHNAVAADAYALLLDGLGKLKELERATHTATSGAKRLRVRLLASPTPPDQKTTILTLSDLFEWMMSQVGASCGRAYVWDRLLNRPRHVWGSGLRLEEFALSSSLRNPVPRRFLLDVAGQGPVVALRTEDLSLHDPGSFCSREGIKASVAVLLTPASNVDTPSSGERILFFLNFRESDMRLKPAQKPEEFAGETARTLELFTRYLNGWLERKALAIVKPSLPLLPGRVASAATALWRLSRDATTESPLPSAIEIANVLAELLTPVGNRPLGVSPTVCEYREADGKACIIFDKRFAVGGASADGYMIQLDNSNNNRLAIGSSLSAQTIVWGRPVLMQLISTESSESRDGWKWLRSLHVSRQETTAIKEAVVPIIFSDRRLGAIAVHEEHPAPRRAIRHVDAAVVELLEACCAAIGGLENMRHLRNVPEIEFFIKSVGSFNTITIDNLLLSLSESIRALTRADFAYVVLYDSVLGFCRPRGVSGSESVFKKLYSLIRSGADLPKDIRDAVHSRDAAIDKRQVRPIIPGDEGEVQLSMLRRAVSIDLMPRRDGISWQVFTQDDREDDVGWDNLRDSDSDIWSTPPELLSRLEADATVRRFRCQPKTDPIGVVWVGRTGGDVSRNLARTQAAKRRSVIEPSHELVLEAMINAAASVIAILKFSGFDQEGVMRPVE